MFSEFEKGTKPVRSCSPSPSLSFSASHLFFLFVLLSSSSSTSSPLFFFHLSCVPASKVKLLLSSVQTFGAVDGGVSRRQRQLPARDVAKPDVQCGETEHFDDLQPKGLAPTSDLYFLCPAPQDSSIIDFYPDDFAIDLNGKKYAWQGEWLLPEKVELGKEPL